MRVAALYDIHGNLPALEAVLQDIHEAEVDEIVVGGDVVLGPMPRESLARLMSLNVPVRFIAGNCEREVLTLLADATSGNLSEALRACFLWTGRQLQPDLDQWVATWPKTLRVKIEGLGEVLFCHATPRDDNEIFTQLTAEDRLLPIFAELDVALVVCGHIHMQYDRMIGSVRVVNAGSVGSPFGKPGAYWLLLGPDVQFRHTNYDLTKAADRIQNTDYPLAQDFAVHSILQPASESEMLEIYSRAEIK